MSHPAVVHVVHSLSRGGAGRAVLSLAQGGDTIAVLTEADPLLRSRAEEKNVIVVQGSDPRAVLADAEIVLVHFWNTPELHELLRGGLPPVRLALWAHVAGDTPPHVLTSRLVELADIVVVTSAYSARLPVLAGTAPVIPAAPERSRLAAAGPRRHRGFNIGYIGTVDYAKLHPRFVELCAAVRLDDARFVVCGSGGAVAELDASGRFDLRGFVEEIAPVLAELDVFGYPLAPGNYSTSDLALQEAMAAGVPPVVLPYGATRGLVDHGVTGLVARDEDEYPRAIEYLHANPEERRRLGRNAHAASSRSPEEVAADWDRVYDELLERPKRARAAAPLSGAPAFVASLEEAAPEFAASLEGSVPEEAEKQISAASPALASAGAGGVLHYRRHYPSDAHLRLWSGLVLEAAGNHVLATAELKAACDRGCDLPRVRRYLASAAAAIGASEAAGVR
ncbi:MAG TPA: glycosyltransferase family 4 protein [Gaiellaceae bacterium]|jgi:glycosyltransferase involved in cell wall biosynthesis|nr:glycosyltransferase family 4 protein [Gaiellaceae bacterium]